QWHADCLDARWAETGLLEIRRAEGSGRGTSNGRAAHAECGGELHRLGRGPKRRWTPGAGRWSSTFGGSVEAMKAVAVGWSAKKKILGKPVYNDKNEKIGVVDELIVTPETSLSYAIIGASEFLGIGKHDVAIPVGQLKEHKGRIVLAGAIKDALKAIPKFETPAGSRRQGTHEQLERRPADRVGP